MIAPECLVGEGLLAVLAREDEARGKGMFLSVVLPHAGRSGPTLIKGCACRMGAEKAIVLLLPQHWVRLGTAAFNRMLLEVHEISKSPERQGSDNDQCARM